MPSKIIGRVLDNTGKPVNKAEVFFKGKKATVTKEDGSFAVSSAKPETRAALTFIKEGYVTNTKVFNFKSQSKYVIIIYPVAYQCWFNVSQDLDIKLGGARIRIPANSLVGPDEKKIKDKALLQFTLFDVTDPFQRAGASGDFTGKMPNGKIVRLDSYGIFDLGIYDKKKQLLKLNRGTAIQLSIPVPPKLAKLAPKSVGFFTMDKISGIWEHSGSFSFLNADLTYNGYVVRFGGSQNLDDPQQTTCITLRVVRMFDSAPMQNFTVVAHGLQYDSFGTTNADGYVCLLVKRNDNFTAESWGDIGQSSYHTISPYTFMSPDISSGPGNCGDPVLCPFLGTVEVDLLVGL